MGRRSAFLCACLRAHNVVFFFSSRRRHTRFKCDWSSDVCSSDLNGHHARPAALLRIRCTRHRRKGAHRNFHHYAVDRTLCRAFLNDLLTLHWPVVPVRSPILQNVLQTLPGPTPPQLTPAISLSTP